MEIHLGENDCSPICLDGYKKNSSNYLVTGIDTLIFMISSTPSPFLPTL
jgi:hypothetical protein